MYIWSLQLPDTSAGGRHTPYNGKVDEIGQKKWQNTIPRVCFKSAPSIHKKLISSVQANSAYMYAYIPYLLQ